MYRHGIQFFLSRFCLDWIAIRGTSWVETRQKELFLIIKSATYKHSVEGEISVFFVDTLPTFSVNISQNKSDYGKKLRIAWRK